MVYDSEGSVSLEAIFQSGNLYGYCGNEPVNRMDPTGEIFMLVTAAIGAAIGGIGGAIYSKVKYGEVRWQNVAIGATIGGVVGLTGGAVASMLATAGSATGVTALAGTKTVLYGMGVLGGSIAGGGGGIVLWSGGKN